MICLSFLICWGAVRPLVISYKNRRPLFCNLPIFAFITKFLLRLFKKLAMITIAALKTIPIAFPVQLLSLAKFLFGGQ